MSEPLRVIIAGGGAAGFFAALACAEAAPGAEVRIFERGREVLAKVRVSGGGRCNVTHACFDPAELVKNYPRGARELLGPFHRFQPRDTVAWFAARGVALKTEGDGRMFPVTDSSQTIVDCLARAAARAGVKVRTECGLEQVARREGGGFRVWFTDGETLECGRLLLATGGARGQKGHGLAEALGHAVEPPVPSLFTFHVDDARLRGLAGVSAPRARLRVPGTTLEEGGPVLVTHQGLSGPGVLRLSAWGARELAARNYDFPLQIQWDAACAHKDAMRAFQEARAQHPRRHVATWPPLELPQRLWARLAAAAGVGEDVTWSTLPKAAAEALAREACAGEYRVAGKSMFKEEFVTCGGVRLREVDFRTMESRACPGLHFAGEVLDADAITGGFNFQAAWTTGWLAGRAMAGVRD